MTIQSCTLTPRLLRSVTLALFACMLSVAASGQEQSDSRLPAPAPSQPLRATKSNSSDIVPLLAPPAAAESAGRDSQPIAKTRPHYRMDVQLQPDQRKVSVRQTVRWTNTGTATTDRLVFQVVPNHRLSEEQISAGERTVESLRLDPEDCIDYEGRRFRLIRADFGGEALKASFSRQHDTHLQLQLPYSVPPGEAIEVELTYQIEIPPVMGRLGQYEGVTNLLNWYPVLAVFTDDWQPVPYVPWHQPWFNEAGDYDVTLTLPADHLVVSGGHVVNRQLTDSGWQQLQIRGEGLRDFTVVASRRFRELTSNVDGIPIRVCYFEEHHSQAQVMLQTAEDCLRLYTSWFGPYPYHEFELTESYFGWNGNESSGVVMVDERIFALPDYAARYVEHLVSHEICHQWWYSAVGTNGYLEPWMDEGLVTWFTRVRMEDKYGANANLLDLPGYGALQFPNVDYRSLVHSGFLMYQGRGGEGAALGTLDEIGHLHNLFFLVYDRGARITGMIQKRMGRDSFFAFLRQLYADYRYRILTVTDFQRELEQFTGQSWESFFQQWLHGTGSSDWAMTDVEVTETGDGGYRTQARISQQGTINEPADVGIAFEEDAEPFRIATLSEAGQVAGDGVTVQQVSPNDWLVTVVSDKEPTQLAVDPDGVVLDSVPYNNRWKPETTVRMTPFYTPVDEAALMQPWQEHGVVGGFGIDAEGRIGLRASVIAANRYRISPFLAYTAATATRNTDFISAGVDAVFFNVPNSNWQLLARYEHALLSTVANDPGHQARIALRRILNYTTSLIYPNLSYIDFYTRFGDNFFPDEQNAPSADPRILQYDDVRAFGVDFHADSQMPYWDPNRGVRFDANYEHGFHVLGGGETYDRVSGQVSVVQCLSNAPGWLSQTKLAGRVAGGYGWSERGEHFRFGGPGRFRGREATRTEGNAFWLTSLEWRFPVIGELDYQVLDNTAALHSVDGSLFYDVGRSYLMNDAQGQTDHAVGMGLYWQIPLLSFVENLTVRTEYGYSLTNSTGVFWFGLYRAF